ncbi:MAG: hypothetical protein K9N06_12350 [Candidatus Cloacimonetes bacterium]|nr:hypothetical protein [Candidatus Cloacimonadota bacterium]
MASGKNCMKLFCWGTLIYMGYKIYRYASGVFNISKELPVYLKNVIGEKPGMNLTVVFNRLGVSLSFSEDIIKEHSDIAELAQEYIGKYYPIFRQDHVTIEVIQKAACKKSVEIDEVAEEDAAEVPEKLEPETV